MPSSPPTRASSTKQTHEPNSNSNPPSTVYSNQKSRHRPQHRPSHSASSSPALPAPPAPAPPAIGSPTPPLSPQQQQHSQITSHGHPYHPSPSPSMGMGVGVGVGMMSVPMTMSSMAHMPTSSSMAVGSIPGAPFYYPYSLFPSHPHIPHAHHHGPPPPHPPAPPAPPRPTRTNSNTRSNDNANSSGGDVHHHPSTSARTTTNTSQNDDQGSQSRTLSRSATNTPISSSASPALLQSSFPASDTTTRPQLIPTFSYYRTRANYDQQHRDSTGRGGKQTANSASAEDNNDGDGSMGENEGETGVDYDVPMPMTMADMHSETRLAIDPALVPPVNDALPPSSSSGPSFIPHGTEKKPNHEYYPSPHHQSQFRELMIDLSTPLPDPPISLNSLVDSEPGKKPAYPLPTIIRCAILGSPHQRLTLSELYLAMERRFGYYTIGDGKSWRNSVRHNLSLNNLFEKVARPITEPGKGCYWVVAHDKPPGNKRERKRNKKPGKRALAAMEREKAAAAAVNGLPRPESGGGRTDDEDEDIEENDEADDSREPDDMNLLLPTLTSTTAAKDKVGGPSTSAATSSNLLASVVSSSATTTTTTVPTTRPLFSFNRGTVAPNEGSYAAVTGIVPMPSQIPLSASFAMSGGRYAGSSSGFGVGPSNLNSSSATAALASSSGGPFSAFTANNNAGSTGAFGAGSSFGGIGYDSSLRQNGSRNTTATSTSTNTDPVTVWSANRASSGSAATKGRTENVVAATKNGRVAHAHSDATAGRSAGTMSQLQSPSQDQDSGPMEVSQTDLGQEQGAVSYGTQGTSIQGSQPPPALSQQEQVSTPFASASASAGEPLLSTHTRPLSAQSSLSSAGFSIPESVSTGSGNAPASATTPHPRDQPEGPGPHRTARQNPARRFDPLGSGPNPSSSSSISQNRPRDTFNTLAAQIASEFQASPSPADATSTPRAAAAARPRPRPRPLLHSGRKKLPVRTRTSDESASGSQSDGSNVDGGGESDENDGDEYVPSGLARRSGRRK